MHTYTMYEHNVCPVVQKFTTSKLDLAWCLHLSETAIKSAPQILLSIICIFRECFITLHTYYYEFTLNIHIQFSRHSQLWILQTGGGVGGQNWWYSHPINKKTIKRIITFFFHASFYLVSSLFWITCPIKLQIT